MMAKIVKPKILDASTFNSFVECGAPRSHSFPFRVKMKPLALACAHHAISEGRSLDLDNRGTTHTMPRKRR